MNHRRGFSLVELLVVMSASAVALTVSASLVHRALRAESSTRKFFEVERTAMRLAYQFRRDVHRAQTAIAPESSEADDVLLQLELPGDERITYRLTEDGLMRSRTTNTSARAIQQYRFESSVGATVRDEEDPRRVTLRVFATPSPLDQRSGAPNELLEVEAYLGRAWRNLDANTVREL